MSREELKELAQTLDLIADGAEWECMWEDGSWNPPLGRDLEYCVGRRIPIRIKPETTNSPANTANTIIALCDGIPLEAQNKTIRMDADDLLGLAHDWIKQKNMLVMMLDKLRNSTLQSEDLTEKITECLKQGEKGGSK